MIFKEQIVSAIESYIADTDYYLVDVKVSADNRISVEIDHFEGVSIDYCVELSKAIESKLDRNNEDFELEVSSAGLTEPFRVLKQYEKNIGNEVEVLTRDGKKLLGVLKSVDNEGVILEQEKMIKPEGAKRKTLITEETNISFDNIKSTKYIIRFK